MIEKKIVKALRAAGITASTRLASKNAGHYVLISRLGGERHYASNAPWNRTGYERAIIGFTVVDTDDSEAYELSDKVADVVENMYLDDNQIVKAEVTGFSSVPLENMSGYIFQAEIIAQR